MAFFSPRTKDMTMTWGKRLILVVLVLCGLVYGVLKLAERSTDSMRLGIQDYLVKTTGHPAEITDVVTVKLIPDVIFRLNGILIRDKEDSKRTIVQVQKAYFATPLWRMFFGQKDYIGFEIQGMDIASGFFLPKKIHLDFVGISDPSPDKNAHATFMADGTYNGKPFLITAEMRRTKKDRYYLYDFSSTFPFTFKLGDTEGDGLYDQGLSSVSLKQVQLVRGSERAEFVVKGLQARPLAFTMQGTINDAPFNATLTQTGQNSVLTMVPEKSADIQKIHSLVTNLQNDIGLEQEDPLQVVVEGMDNANKDDKKKETEEKK